MAQITDGLRSVLSNPIVYFLFQKMLGVDRVMRKFVVENIQPVAGMAVLDVGCGPGHILSYFPPVDYWGFDISPPYIAYAKNHYSDRGKFFCKFLSNDDLTAMPKFDIVILLGVLHHLDNSEAKDLISLAHHSLKQNGRLVTIDACIAPNQNPLARFLISKDRGQNVREEAGYRRLVADLFPDAHLNIRHRKWIPYTHCIMECRKSNVI